MANATEQLHIPGLVIDGELGRGAHSTVYRGRTSDGVACAIKVPRSRGRWTRWVYREAVALARVREPGLPAVLEVGVHDDTPFLVMELIDGPTLAERLARGALSPDETGELVRKVAHTLAAVHDVGLVHRDVKPRNIVFDATGRPRLVDFGFATPIERVGIVEPAGTPGYSAPEQLRAPARVDGRADLYALGRVAWACLAPDTDLGWLDDVGGLRVSAGIDGDLRTILRGLTALDPDARYPDARALLLDLTRWRAGEGVVGAVGALPSPRVRPWSGRTAELQALMRSWNERDGAGAVAVVRGGRGAGKTRFLEAAVERWIAAARGPVLLARCHDGQPPLATLRRLIDAHFEAAGALGPSALIAAETAIREAVGDDLEPFATLIAPRLAELLGKGAHGEPAAMNSFQEAACELFVRLVRIMGPTLIVVDDAPYMDPASHEVLLRLAHRAADVPVAVVVAGRPDAVLDRFDGVGPARVTRVALGSLEAADVASLIAAYLGRPDVDPIIARRISSLSDGSPLGVLETLRAFLDAGALRPRRGSWALDVPRAETVTLPEGALDLLGGRISELPPASRRVMEVAAILGTGFDDGLLAAVLELGADELDFALADARRAGLIEPTASGGHAFTHEGYRETILRGLAPAAQLAVHQLVAEELERRGDTSLEALCAKALHYAAGDLTQAPRRAFEASRIAAERALALGDERTALRFFSLASAAAATAQQPLGGAFLRLRGEAQFRAGSLLESLDSFEEALRLARNKVERATVLACRARVFQASAEPDRAWLALELAFDALGERMPKETAQSAVDTLSGAARRGLSRFRRSARAPSAEVALLCDLHYQNARLGLEYGKPFRLVQSTLAVLELSEATGRSRVRARSLAMYGFVQTALGRAAAGASTLTDAEAMAVALADPITEAFCTQLRALGACWAGRLDDALTLSHRLVDQAHWLDLNQFEQDMANADLIEAVRGRPLGSFHWLGLAAARMRRSRPSSAIAGHLGHRARALLAVTGGRPPSPSVLRFQDVADAAEATPDDVPGFLRLTSWGARARAVVDAGRMGEELDELVADFEAEKISPTSAHPAVTEYYIAVAHARIHQALRAEGRVREVAIDKLRRAAADLRKAAKLPLFKAHAVVVDAYLAWFDGDAKRAAASFQEAARLAEEETCPWVLSAVARARAHQLRALGKPDAALDQARIAEALARENGAIVRARWIREELGLPEPVADPRPSSTRAESQAQGRQLASLLHVLRSGARDMRSEDQAAAVVQDILLDLDCERASLLFQPDAAARTRLWVGRTRAGDPFACEGWRDELLRAVRETGRAWPPDVNDGSGPPSPREAVDPRRVLALPLVLHDRVAGALCVERQVGGAPFGADERELLLVLAKQLPLALEVARLVVEREQLQASLQQAQRMEAVGQLAGGVAHDFNNMLTAIQTSIAPLAEHVRGDADASAEVDLIASAAQRAGQLTKKLLAFSRHQPLPLAACDVNDLLRGLVPMLRRLVGSAVAVELELELGAHVVSTDRAAFEQALVNLAVNARDAMPRGGALAISTSNVWLDAAAVRRGAPKEGAYLQVAVADDGQGMSAELLSRVFEPFFTTKGPGGGTGLGLTTVYAFMKNSGGHLEVVSEVGRGTTFRLFLPAEVATRPARIRRATPIRESRSGAETILVVDDEHLVARSIQKTLQRKGYEVLLASDATRAIELVESRAHDISLIIIDMLMPGMTGPELGRRLEDMQIPAKLLYVSGYAPGNLPVQEEGLDPATFLQKPFSPSELLGRVGQLLDAV